MGVKPGVISGTLIPCIGIYAFLSASVAGGTGAARQAEVSAPAPTTIPIESAGEPADGSPSIRGKVVVQGLKKSASREFNPYSELYGSPHKKAAGTERPGHLLVYLEHVPGKWHPPAKHAILDQVNRQFTVDLLPVLVGTVVNFTNHDRIYHNVFTYSELQPFDLGRRARNETRSVEFHRLPQAGIGVIRVGCEIHANMHSVILVMRNPFWAVVDENGGSFEIRNVPPGTYTLTGWHDSLKAEPVRVDVASGRVAEVVLNMAGGGE